MTLFALIDFEALQFLHISISNLVSTAQWAASMSKACTLEFHLWDRHLKDLQIGHLSISPSS